MPQNAPSLSLGPVNVTGTQVPFMLGTVGLASVGSPGGPVIFSRYGAHIVPSLYGSVPQNVVGARQT